MENEVVPPHLNLRKVVDLKITLTSHTAVMCSNRQFIFGGLLDKKKSKELFELTPEFELKKLEPTGGIPPERTAHTAILRKITNENETKETMVWKIHFKNAKIIFGGLSGKTGGFKTMSDVYEYSPEENRWTKLYQPKDLLIARKEHSAIYREETDTMVVYGGSMDNSKITNTIVEFSFKDASWSSITPQTSKEGLLLSNQKEEIEGRSGHSANYYNEKMYVFGGISEKGYALNDMWEFNFKTSMWKRLQTPFKSSKIPCPVFGHQSFLTNEISIMILGGRDKNSYYSHIHMYNIVTEQWEKLRIFGNSSKNIQIGNFAYGSVAFDNSVGIYYFGGRDDKTNSSELMYFEFDKKTSTIEVNEQELSLNFSKLLQDEKLSDLMIEVQGFKFHVHELIISSCEELTSRIKNHSISINDIQSDVFYNVLEYLYGNIPQIKGRNIVKVLKAAEMLKIKALSNWCHFQVQQDFIDDSNVVEIFSLAKDELFFDVVTATLSYMLKNWQTAQHLIKGLDEEKINFIKKNLKNTFEKKTFSNEIVHPYVYLRHHLSKLRRSNEGDIVVILGDDSRMKLHKVVLYTRCTYFHTLFSGMFSDSNSAEIVLEMTDDSVLFDYILDYLYGIDVKFITDTEEEMIDLLLKTIILSNSMSLTQLESLTEDLVLKRISPINAFQIYCYCSTQNKYYQVAFIKRECVRLLKMALGQEECNRLIKEIDEQFQEELVVE